MGTGSKKKINCCVEYDLMFQLGGGVGRYMGTGSKKKINWKLGEDILGKMWTGIRQNNGIMVAVLLSH